MLLLLLCDRNIVAHVCGDPLSRYTCRATRLAANPLERALRFETFCNQAGPIELVPRSGQSMVY